MTIQALFSLLPIILISIGLLVLMMVIAFHRHPVLSYQITLTTLSVTFISLFIIADLLPQQATPLILMDSYSQFFIGIVLLTAMLLMPLCHDYWAHHQQIREEFYLLYLLSVLGAMVLIASNHFASFFLGLELMTLPLIVMVGYPFFSRYSAALESAIKYLILSAAASATLLFGMALIYSQVATLEFIAIGEAIAEGH
ncbi:MAG: proton-conducting transporter membrane subunit, partial [Motiliproteus sp.]|nr:proton-conducting transporter membrane subunit [Motiliproteus sp.]